MRTIIIGLAFLAIGSLPASSWELRAGQTYEYICEFNSVWSIKEIGPQTGPAIPHPRDAFFVTTTLGEPIAYLRSGRHLRSLIATGKYHPVISRTGIVLDLRNPTLGQLENIMDDVVETLVIVDSTENPPQLPEEGSVTVSYSFAPTDDAGSMYLGTCHRRQISQ